MKRKVLDHEISSLLLGELDEEATLKLKERIREEDGNLDRIERFKDVDAAFLERFPAKVFAAQVESGLRKNSFELQTNIDNDKQREGRMIIGKRLLLGMTALTVAGFFANDLHTKLTTEVSFAPSKNAAKIKSINEPVELRPLRPMARSFDGDFSRLQETVGNQTDLESVVSFRTFLSAHPLKEDPDKIMWVYDQYASLLEKNNLTGKPAAAVVRTQIVEAFTNMTDDTKENLEMSKEGIAKSLFMDSEEKLLKISAALNNAAGTKSVVREPYSPIISKNLKAIIALEIPHWSVAAYYRLATISLDEANAIKNIGFAKGVERQIEIEALGYLKKGLEFTEVKSPYFDESRLRFERLKNRVCPSERQLEALHSMLWHVEHSTTSTAQLFVNDFGPWPQAHFPELKTLQSHVLNGTPRNEIHVEAEALRAKTEDNWICLSKEVHSAFHERLAETTSIPEQLSRLEIKSIIEQNRESFRACSEKSSPSTGGKVRFSVASSGAVESLSLPTRFAKTKVGMCVKDIFAQMTFPESKTESVSISYPVSFLSEAQDLKSGLSDKQLNKEALRALVNGDFSKAIRMCSDVKTGCDRTLAVAYKNNGDVKNACKHMRLAGIASMSGLQCDAGKRGGNVSKKIVPNAKSKRPVAPPKNTSVKQTLSRTDIKSTIRKYGGRIANCAKTSNAKGLKGSVKVGFYIKPSGRVTGAKLVGPFRGTDVGRCVQKVVAGMKYPKTLATKNTKITYPFSLR